MIKEKLLIDDVSYNPYNYKSEEEFEKIIIEHYKKIFWDNSLYFGKQKIESKAGVGSIPDGFTISFGQKSDVGLWYVLEVELSSHPAYGHGVSQLNKFKKAIQNPETRKKIVDAIDNEITSDTFKENLVKKNVPGEIYKFLFGLITIDNFNPLIIIDDITNEWEEAFEDFIPKIKFMEFKTFEKEGVGLGVHAHLFKPLYTPTIQTSIWEPEERTSNDYRKPLILEIKPSWISHGVICIPTKHENFFPEEKGMFWMEIDGVQVEKHVSSLKITMKGYYRKHPKLKAGDKLIIESIEPKKQYRLRMKNESE